MIKINGEIFGNDLFPNNEKIFKTLNTFPLDHKFDIEFQYLTDSDIFSLIVAKKYIDETYNNSQVNLYMNYVPYSRMDRKIECYVFSLKYFCQLINSLNFTNVYILDPHSNVTPALLNRCFELYVPSLIGNVISKTKPDYIFFPDSGAHKRYIEIFEKWGLCFYGNKKRNLDTGKVIDYELVNCPQDIKDKTVLIVDDLCAKGYTFYLAAQKLKEVGSGKIYLYVSHCENSVHEGLLVKSGLIDKIYTTDSIFDTWTELFVKIN